MAWKQEFERLIKAGSTKEDLLAKALTVQKVGWINETEYNEIISIINEAFI